MIDWREIETVLLDMDGTLLDLHFDNHFWREHVPLRYAEKHNLEIEQAKSLLYGKFRLKEGTMDWYCVEYWSRELELDIFDLKQEIHHLIAVHNHVEEFLRRTRGAGKQVVMLTNAHARSLDLKMDITGLTAEFDALICAHDIGYPKEDPRFWTLLGDRLPFDSDATLFIDDNPHILRTARDYGIRHLLAVRRPDSRSPPRESGEFRAIDGFDQIMPQARASAVPT